MTVSPGDIVRATCKMTLSGTEDLQNVYYFQHAGSVVLSDAVVENQMISFLNTAYDKINNEQSNQVDYTTVNLYNVTTRELVAESPWPGVSSGTRTDPALPYQVSALITFPTALAKTLGKKYIGGFTEFTNGQYGTPTAALITALGNFAVDLLSGLEIGGEPFPIGHIRTDPLTFIAWSTGLIEALWATQRRRKFGIGS